MAQFTIPFLQEEISSKVAWPLSRSVASGRKRLPQMSNLLLDFVRPRHRARNLLPEQLSMARPHSLHSRLHRRLGQAKPVRDLRVRRRADFAWLKILEQVKQVGLARRDVF